MSVHKEAHLRLILFDLCTQISPLTRHSGCLRRAEQSQVDLNTQANSTGARCQAMGARSGKD